MNIGKRLVLYIGAACLLVLSSFPPVYSETSEPGAPEENAGAGLNGSTDDIRYVRDFIVITMRSGMGDAYKVIGNLKTDDRIEVLQEEEDFLRVRTEKGEEGWVRSQYTTKDLPKFMTIERLRNENERLKASVTSLQGDIAEMRENRNVEIEQRDDTARQLQQQLKNSENAIAALKKEKAGAEDKYDKLLNSSSNVAALMKELEDTKKKNSELNQEMAELRDANRLLEKDKDDLIRLRLLKWFLSGGAILFVGFILGWIFRRKDYY